MKSNHNHNKHATTRTEENNRKTTKSNAGVRNSEPPGKPKKQPNTIIIRKSEF
jgi:hypothetical protein